MTPVTGGSSCARETAGNSERKIATSALFTALPQLAQRDEFIPFGLHSVDELFQRADTELRANEHRVPEKRRPRIAHDLVEARSEERRVGKECRSRGAAYQ